MSLKLKTPQLILKTKLKHKLKKMRQRMKGINRIYPPSMFVSDKKHIFCKEDLTKNSIVPIMQDRKNLKKRLK